MNAPSNLARKAIRLAHGLVDSLVLAGILGLLGFAGYSLWDSHQVYQAAEDTQYATYKPTTAGRDSFAALQAINPEVIAWLTVYGTHIDYPVTQADNNLKYINTSAEGTYSLSGAIFLDSANAADFSDFANIVYGHHMAGDAMFGDIGQFADQGFFESHRYGSLWVDGQLLGLDFFAFIHDDAYDESVYRPGTVDPAARQAYLASLTHLSVQDRTTVAVTPADRIVLLSTCSAGTTNGRDILVGKITAAAQSDPFATAGPDTPAGLPDRAGLAQLWSRAPWWQQTAAVGLPGLAVALAVVLLVRRRRRARPARYAMKG